MLIDWFTVCAQILNFLILVVLMKRFLYKPILGAIDAREKKIAKEIKDADAKKADSQREHQEFQHKNDEFDQERAALMSKATDDAKAEGERIVAEAGKAADALAAKRQEALEADAKGLREDLSRRASQEVFAVARKALEDLATTSLEERLGDVFTRRLGEMDATAKSALGEALRSAPAPSVVRSTFELPAPQRDAIQTALNETFSASVDLTFETSPDLISGIELTANGQKLAWSIGDYLNSMQKSVDQAVSAPAGAGASS